MEIKLDIWQYRELVGNKSLFYIYSEKNLIFTQLKKYILLIYSHIKTVL